MNRVEQYEWEIERLEEKILEIQIGCSHPIGAVDRVARSSQGNYDPTQDAYWYECYCTLCHKSWTEPQ